MKNPIRNETSLVLVVAVILSAVAIPVFSGFLEPSQPPAVAAVQIGYPRDGDGDAPRPADSAPAGQAERREPRAEEVQRRRRAPQPTAPEPPTQRAPSAPADDAAEDDGGEAD